MGTEIREVHQAIGIQDTDHTDVPEIQTFREHLSSDQYLCLTFLKVRDDPLIGRTGAGGIEIQTLDLAEGKRVAISSSTISVPNPIVRSSGLWHSGH